VTQLIAQPHVHAADLIFLSGCLAVPFNLWLGSRPTMDLLHISLFWVLLCHIPSFCVFIHQIRRISVFSCILAVHYIWWRKQCIPLTHPSFITGCQSNLAMAVSRPLPFPVGHWDSHLTLCSLDPGSLHPKQYIDPFSRSLQGADAWQSDWQTHPATETSVAIVCIDVAYNLNVSVCAATLNLDLQEISF